MRALILPQVSVLNLPTDSDVSTHKAYTAVIRRREKSRFWFWARQGDEEFGQLEPDFDMLYDDARTQRGFYALMATADLSKMVDLFSWQCGLYPIDAVFTSRSGVAANIALALSCGNGQYSPPVVITEPRVYGPGDVFAHNVVTPLQQAVRAAGYASCYGMYMSDWEKKQALAASRLYVSSAVLEGWDQRAYV